MAPLPAVPALLRRLQGRDGGQPSLHPAACACAYPPPWRHAWGPGWKGRRCAFATGRMRPRRRWRPGGASPPASCAVGARTTSQAARGAASTPVAARSFLVVLCTRSRAQVKAVLSEAVADLAGQKARLREMGTRLKRGSLAHHPRHGRAHQPAQRREWLAPHATSAARRVRRAGVERVEAAPPPRTEVREVRRSVKSMNPSQSLRS